MEGGKLLLQPRRSPMWNEMGNMSEERAQIERERARVRERERKRVTERYRHVEKRVTENKGVTIDYF